MTPDDRDPAVKRLFEGLKPPAPPPQLRSRVLATARGRKMETPDLWTRIWNQRGLRLAWVAAIVLLLAGHAVVVPGTGNAFRTIDPALNAENRIDGYLVGMLRPTRISDSVQPIVGLLAAADSMTELDLQRNPS